MRPAILLLAAAVSLLGQDLSLITCASTLAIPPQTFCWEPVQLDALGTGTPALPAPTRTFPVADVVSVYDGDTATVSLELGLDVRITKTVRVFGIDTPEVRPLATREAGYRARDWLRERLASCADLRAVTGTKEGRPAIGKYGRLLVTFECEGSDLTREMIDLGLGVPYFGGAK